MGCCWTLWFVFCLFCFCVCALPSLRSFGEWECWNEWWAPVPALGVSGVRGPPWVPARCCTVDTGSLVPLSTRFTHLLLVCQLVV